MLTLFQIRCIVEVTRCKVDIASDNTVFGRIVPADEYVVNMYFLARVNHILKVDCMACFVFTHLWRNMGIGIPKVTYCILDHLHIFTHTLDIEDLSFCQLETGKQLFCIKTRYIL